MSGKTNWWYSVDGKRGFCLASVKGFDYKALQQASSVTGSVLYLYIDGGIMHLTGGEADTVYKLINAKAK